MEHKGTIWIIIFFLIIIFILTNTVDVSSYITSPDYRVVDNQQHIVDVTFSESTVDGINPPEETTFEQFHISGTKPNQTLTFTVSNKWFSHYESDPESISIYYLADDMTRWYPYDLEITFNHATGTDYRLDGVMDGHYLIVGEQGTAPSGQKQTLLNLGTLISVIAILLFLAYHTSSKRSIKNEHAKASIERLDAYIRKAELEGKSAGDIKATLEVAGWHDEQINQGLRRTRYF